MALLKQILTDYSLHPLIPGAVLTSLVAGESNETIGRHGSRPWKIATAKAQGFTCIWKSRVGCTEISERIQRSEGFRGCLRATGGKIKIALVTQGDRVHQAARTESGIGTPNVGMVGDHGQSGAILRKTRDGTRDLIQELKLRFRHIVGGVWGVLSTESFGLSTDASGQFWTAFMYPRTG